MYWLKSCPRCKGDLAEEDDIQGKEILCIQCGFRPTFLEKIQFKRWWEERAVKGNVPSMTKVS